MMGKFIVPDGRDGSPDMRIESPVPPASTIMPVKTVCFGPHGRPRRGTRTAFAASARLRVAPCKVRSVGRYPAIAATMASKSAALSDAPPTRAPSTSSTEEIAPALAGLTEPP